MARLSLSRNAERRKRIVAVMTVWLEMCTAVSCFLSLLSSIASLHSYRPRVRGDSLDFGANREYMRRIVHDNDESCIALLRMNRLAFFKLCEMLETVGGLKKKKKTNGMGEPVSAEAIINAAMLLGDNIREVGKELSHSIGTELKIQQRVGELDGALGEIEGLTEDERDDALSKIPDHPAQMLVFFSLVPSRRLGWVRRFLARH